MKEIIQKNMKSKKRLFDINRSEKLKKRFHMHAFYSHFIINLNDLINLSDTIIIWLSDDIFLITDSAQSSNRMRNAGRKPISFLLHSGQNLQLPACFQ